MRTYCLLALSLAGPAQAAPEPNATVSAVCELVTASARREMLPVGFLTRLIWQESHFRADAVSPAGATGIAQFMPGTASARGLENPFDPEAAIPAAAHLLAELRGRFGNLGLAAAAYNAGPGAVAGFLSGRGLPQETRGYVAVITGHAVEDWQGEAAAKLEREAAPDLTCEAAVAAALKTDPNLILRSVYTAPWGVEIAASFDKASALRAFKHVRAINWTVLAGAKPMIVGVRLPGRKEGLYYRVRAPARTKGQADAMCGRLSQLGVKCAVEKS